MAPALWTHQGACLHCLADPPRVPIANNQAERALRMVKLPMKISGSFRTVAERFAQVRGPRGTGRKQGRDLLAVLQPNPVLP